MLKNNLNKKKIWSQPKKIVILLIIIFGSMIFVFNDIGIFKWMQLRKQRNNLQGEIDRLILKEKKLIDKLYQIESDDDYIKKIARERFHMVRPGEKVFRVVDRRKVIANKQE